jgi:hypothetical protein
MLKHILFNTKPTKGFMKSAINLFLLSLLIGSLVPYEMSATSGGGGGGGSSNPHHGKAPRGLRDGGGGGGGSRSRAPGDGGSTSTRWSQQVPTLCTLCQGLMDVKSYRWEPIPYHILPIDGESTCDMCGNIEYPDKDKDGKRRSKRVRRAESHVSGNSLAMLALAAQQSPPASPVPAGVPASAAGGGGGVGAAAGAVAVVAAGPVADDSSDENEDGGGAARQFKCPYCNHSGSRSARDSHVPKHTNLYDPTKDYFCLQCPDQKLAYKVASGSSMYLHLKSIHGISSEDAEENFLRPENERSIPADLVCPYCPHQNATDKALRTHLGRHVHLTRDLENPRRPYYEAAIHFVCKLCGGADNDPSTAFKIQSIRGIVDHIYTVHASDGVPARLTRSRKNDATKIYYQNCFTFPSSSKCGSDDSDDAGEGSPDTTGGGGSGAPAGGGSGAGAGGGGSGRFAAV